MAVNPLERKSRNSFLLGMVITLLVTGCIIAFLLMQLVNINKERQEEKAKQKSVYALNMDVKSGQVITKDMLNMVKTTTSPWNAIIDTETLDNYSLSDAEGNDIYTDAEGLYLMKNSEYLELYKESEKDEYYTYSSEGEKQIANLSTKEKENIKSDDFGMYVVRETEQKTRVYKEENTENYYILKMSYRYNAEENKQELVREKEYIQLNGTALIAKIDMQENTIITLEMIAKSDEALTDDVRRQEYNCLVLPIDLETGDYIDIRLMLPNGQDYIVISKKQVEIASSTMDDGTTLWQSSDTIWINLQEDEILTMSCAIVDAYKITGAKLYATVYTEPGMQNAAETTYLINAETAALIQKDPNVLSEALKELQKRYSGSDRNMYLDMEILKENNPDSNYQGKMQESITNTQEQRLEYLESLAE